MERASFGAGSFDAARASNEQLQPSRFTRPICYRDSTRRPGSIEQKNTASIAARGTAMRSLGGRWLCRDYHI
jgi:hypothetical protein